MIDKFEELIENAGSIGIAGHVRPDGDCVGSCMATYNYIINKYPDKDVHVILQTIPTTFRFLKNTQVIEPEESSDTSRSFDLFIALDCAEGTRLGNTYEVFKNSKTTMVIDHHHTNGDFADYSYIIDDYSSTCELLYNQFIKDEITKEIAECLYVGIIHDTGVFQYTCCTSDTMKAAGFLMDKGIDYSAICNETYFNKSLKQLKMTAQALSGVRMFSKNRIIASVTTQKDLAKEDALPRHLEGIVQEMRATTGVEVAVYLYETAPGEYKGSTRAVSDVDLTVICGKYGGGGHKKASGFSVTTDKPWEVIDDVVIEIEKQFKELGI